MRTINYELGSTKNINEANIAICSDIHISQLTTTKKTNKIIQLLNNAHPTHIVIPGDLCDLNMDSSADSKVELFVKEITHIAPVFYVRGNTDQMSLLPLKLSRENPNFHLLGESDENTVPKVINKDGINFIGVKLPVEFYGLSESEKKKFLWSNLRDYLKKTIQDLNPMDFNLLLCHDPMIKELLTIISYYYPDEISSTYDLSISGHNHGGIWPSWIKPLLRLTGANMELCYPTYTKGMLDAGLSGEKIIVSQGVTKFHSGFGLLHHLENFHQGTIEMVKIKKMSI